MCAHVTELEEQIEACAMVLSSSQPPYEGKYDVRWWVIGAAADGRSPVLVRWMKGPGRGQVAAQTGQGTRPPEAALRWNLGF